LPEEAALLNTELPARFFDLQDDLRAAAGQLADEATGGDDQKMAAAFGRLTSTCVSCHSVYLEAPPAKH
jgi:cytochrome c556